MKIRVSYEMDVPEDVWVAYQEEGDETAAGAVGGESLEDLIVDLIVDEVRSTGPTVEALS